MGDRTLLAITHRNTLVRLATRVLVVDQGTLVADEPPEKLLGPRPT
jgi:ATP-binding cassette subfamily C protein LapB